MRAVLFLAQAEVLHVIRDRAMLVQVLLVPVIQLLVLGNAATFQLRNTPTYVVDLDQSEASRSLVSHLAGSGHFRLIGGEPSLERASQALLSGDATLTVIVPQDFERDLVTRRRASVALTVDAVRGSSAGIVQAYASRVIAAFADERAAMHPAAGAGLAGAGARVDVQTRSRYNPTLNYPHYMVPGILVALVTMIATLLTAQNIAREKELGTLDQLNVTPITRGQFIAGKLLPFWVLGLVELTMGLLAAKLVFDIPIRGSLVLLLLVAGVYLVVALGIGLLISTRVETQQQAMFIAFFIVNIYLLMSGLFTPIDSMAPWMQEVSVVNPVRHFVAISRAILVKGAGFSEIVRPLGLLSLFAVVALGVAVQQYRKRTS
ncbi:MAG: ABC transporter permease [Vicinamibacterales bacterium]